MLRAPQATLGFRLVYLLKAYWCVSLLPHSLHRLVRVGFQQTTNRPACLSCDNLYGSPLAGYIGEFEFVDNHRSGKIVVELNGR